MPQDREAHRIYMQERCKGERDGLTRPVCVVNLTPSAGNSVNLVPPAGC
jgi:hypothetical protein